MPVQDFLKRQIDQMSLVLASLISKVLGMNDIGNLAVVTENVNDVLTSELSIRIDEIAKLNHDDFIHNIEQNKSFNSTNIQLLADLFFEFANLLPDEDSNKKMLFEKCLHITQYLEQIEKTYSVDRQKRIVFLKNCIED